MPYQFPPDIDRRIKALLQSGPFQTEDDVLREAMDTLERRQRALANLQEMVREADEDVAAGRVGPFDTEETKRSVRERLAQDGVIE